MEQQSENNNRLELTKAVVDGLEFIRRSGATNMLDRPTVLALAKEWGFTKTVAWIESVDTATYGRLIFQGPEIMESEQTEQAVEPDSTDQPNEFDAFSQSWNYERARVQEIISALGKQAILTIADTVETEQMGMLINSPFLTQINAERDALLRNLGEASRRWLQLQESMSEVERGIGSLRFLIDPENH